MTFLWPGMLFSLFLIPVILVIYLLVTRQRRIRITGFSKFNTQKQVKKQTPGFRRHLPPVLFLLSLVILLVALARPQAEVNLPTREGTAILVFDVSGSMAAEDVEPTRMEAAKAAARAFVLSQPETVQIGIVSFSGSGFTVQNPTNDTEDLLAAINRLEPQSGTSLGQGILVALNTIAVNAGLEPTSQSQSESDGPAQEGAQNSQEQGSPEEELLSKLPEGSYPASVIVLLSDGENNQSIDPNEAAQAASEHDVRIDAIGFGTTAGITLEVDGFSIHTALDEATLQQITQAAGGTYYNAQAEQDPQEVYKNLVPRLVIKPEKTEITALLIGASILVSGLGAMFSLLWFNRLP